MSKRHLFAAAVLSIGMLLFSGCLWAPSLERLKKEIENQIPEARFDKEVALTLGPVSIGIARVVTRFIPETKEARPYLKNVRKVELAVYNTKSLPPLDGLRFPARLKSLVEQDNWDVAVKVRQEDELVWILVHERRNQIDAAFVVVINHENLVLMRLKGQLNEIVLRSLKEADVLPAPEAQLPETAPIVHK
ncbi:MAG: DUF4252 domain-containing protein [Candidatus Latescibacteria bacterium]|nr:DUF4252 domain-containing protein [Candidatus Latescibacterota bacterium]NIO00970.1 DUF4252 domain-containing protein [Candidatus Latescibacterota bacterium]NIO27369.1 DUF4252 domain-containing protein [Candidatus Latescibacterota bacterium]NIO54891.1 DUF4252 domain-containing protein [Candidatus Latescibacterota bacterium]NIT00980.1 DUF4252 domain-containing protein [Candidatus Latescibacterota bacterium]